MKLTAADLYELGIIEKVIPEYPVINENNIKRVTLYMKRMICDFMYRYIDMDKEELVKQRYNRFRKYKKATKFITFFYSCINIIVLI